MKKRILIISIFSVCLIVPSVLLIAKNTAINEKVAIMTSFKMELIDDGKILDSKMLVNLTIIEQDNGDFYVEWNEVFIKPFHERKVVILKPVHHSTLDGSIKNVIVTKTGFSFVIDLSRQFGGAGRTLQIVGKKKSGGFIFDEYDVKGSGLWWSEILKESIRKDLRSTDKKIILPYKEVF